MSDADLDGINTNTHPHFGCVSDAHVHSCVNEHTHTLFMRDRIGRMTAPRHEWNTRESNTRDLIEA